MPWVSITTNDVLAVLNNSELATYQQFRQAPGQSDPLVVLIGHVTHEVHAFVRVRHTLDAGGGIPQSLVGSASAIIAYRLLLRCNAKPGDGRKASHDHALKFLESVGRGAVGIEMPATPAAEQTSAPAPRIRRRHLRFTHHDEDGI